MRLLPTYNLPLLLFKSFNSLFCHYRGKTTVNCKQLVNNIYQLSQKYCQERQKLDTFQLIFKLNQNLY